MKLNSQYLNFISTNSILNQPEKGIPFLLPPFWGIPTGSGEHEFTLESCLKLFYPVLKHFSANILQGDGRERPQET